jgi:hypothetical protein
MTTAIKDIPGKHVARSYVLAQGTAGTADTWPVCRAPGNIVVTAVRWIPAAAVSGAATNNFALALQNKGADGLGTTAVTATKTYDNGVDSVAHAAESLTLLGTAADLNVDEGDVLSLVRTVNGTGLASPDGLVEVEYKYR